ncbi:MAG: N-acetylglutaminylglutamine synthetase [Halieaceae bacterium]|jgi:GNAT-family acetyltransferase (TIGR03103 family)|nr:N-acetylglutaminylglutamine synthetase [Halieaceae bacterium]
MTSAKHEPRFSDPSPSYEHLLAVQAELQEDGSLQCNAAVGCGWGRVIMGHTFEDPEDIAHLLLRENPGKRDIALYVADPHIVLATAPQALFLDPSDTFRLDLDRSTIAEPQAGIRIIPLESAAQAEAVSDLYLKRSMVPTDPGFVLGTRDRSDLLYLVAEEEHSGAVVGSVMGINHGAAFADPTRGSSLWCLCVDPQATMPGIGEALTRSLAKHLREQGCAYMDLSVLHNNQGALQLYEKLGFRQVHTFAVKNKNAFNETLFLGPELEENLNPYARVIVDEARARGIGAEVLDAEEGYFRLSRGGRTIDCRESLSELTSAVAMSRCHDKAVTHRWLAKAGLNTPSHCFAGRTDANVAFLQRHGSIVVKPATGEQGRGITVDVSTRDALDVAIEEARRFDERVLLESFHPGLDLRIVVIGFKVVAAAVRKPPQVVGDGEHSIAELVDKLSRRRSASTNGESVIRIDNDALSALASQGFEPDSVPPSGAVVAVRKTANLHTGGTMHDVTDRLHSVLVDAAVKAARQLSIPVVGLDLIVPSPHDGDYVILEANERVGLANHEPQPTAERFLDLLFPLSKEVAELRRSGMG